VGSSFDPVLAGRTVGRLAAPLSLDRFVARWIRIAPRETDFDVRGFAPCPARVRRLLELHGASFARGFNTAIAAPAMTELDAQLAAVPGEERGFAFEGAGMGLALLDLILPGRPRRLAALLRGPGAPHVYMVHVGAGWALARLRRRPWGRLPLDPLLRWLALDGYGFHDAFFHPDRVVRRRRVPRRLDAEGGRVFDQGVGRALWFVDAADPERIARSAGAFEERRRADIWSGVGLAAAYAGGLEPRGLERLVSLAGTHLPHLAQGVAFAATARLRAGNVVPHTERACSIVCGIDAAHAAAVTGGALAATRGGASAADYERWRTAIRNGLAG
jgi:enediyne biosynthesis protein E3